MFRYVLVFVAGLSAPALPRSYLSFFLNDMPGSDDLQRAIGPRSSISLGSGREAAPISPETRGYQYWIAFWVGNASAYALILGAADIQWWLGTLVSLVYLIVLLIDLRNSSLDSTAAVSQLSNDVVNLTTTVKDICLKMSSSLGRQGQGHAAADSNSSAQETDLNNEDQRVDAPSSARSPKPFTIRTSLFSSNVWFALLTCAMAFPSLTLVFGRNHWYDHSFHVPWTNEDYSDPWSKKSRLMWSTNWTSVPPILSEKWSAKNWDDEGMGPIFLDYIKVGNVVYFLDWLPSFTYLQTLYMMDSALDPEIVNLTSRSDSKSDPTGVDEIFAASDRYVCGVSDHREPVGGGMLGNSTIFCGDKDDGFGMALAQWTSGQVGAAERTGNDLVWLLVLAYNPDSNKITYDSPRNEGFAIVSLNVTSMNITLHSKLEIAHDEPPTPELLFFVCPVILISLLVWYFTEIESIFWGMFVGTVLVVVFSPSWIENGNDFVCFNLSPYWILASVFLSAIRSSPTRLRMCAWSIALPILAGFVGAFEIFFAPWAFSGNAETFEIMTGQHISTLFSYSVLLVAAGLATGFDLVFLAGFAHVMALPVVTAFYYATHGEGGAYYALAAAEVAAFVVLCIFRSPARSWAAKSITKCVRSVGSRLNGSDETEGLLQETNNGSSP